jgi:hypothetical protein
MVTGREVIGIGEDDRRGEGQEVGTELQEKLTPYRDEVRVLLDLEENEFAGLLEREDDVGDGLGDQRGAVVESSSARAARGNRLAREAGGDVNNRLVGDGARETGIEDGNGAGVNDGVQTDFVSVLLTKRGDAGAAVGEGERDGADAGKPLDDGGVVSGEPPRRG